MPPQPYVYPLPIHLYYSMQFSVVFQVEIVMLSDSGHSRGGVTEQHCTVIIASNYVNGRH